MVTKEFHNDVISIQIKDGILFGEYLVDKVDLEGATLATNFRKEITQNEAYPAFVDVSLVKEVSREARSFFAQEAGEDLKAIAVVVRNPVTRMMVNFFMKFNQPGYPIKFFTKDQEALEWLQQYVEKGKTSNAREDT
jgi:hypothetical protein